MKKGIGMLLTVDIGNTNIKVGAWDGNELIFVSSMHTNLIRTSDEYAVKLLDVFRLREYNSAQFDGAMIASVVPPLSTVLRKAVMQVIQTDRVFIASAGIETGLKTDIEGMSQLGADLYCAAAALARKMPLPCLFISLGTATVIFAIDRDARILGGALCPGIGISLEALAARTAQLPHISLDDPGPLIGQNTVDCMKSGIVYGTAAMLDGVIGRMRAEIGGEASCVAFGGFARTIIPHCREAVTVDDSLVLEGLKILYESIMNI